MPDAWVVILAETASRPPGRHRFHRHKRWPTGVAAIAEGFDFVGCELSEGYAAIARKRLEAYGSTIPPTDRQAFAHTPAPGPTV